MQTSRRSFLTAASMLAAGNVLGFQPFGAMNALAQTSNDYKALVCVFMLGGNDANNTLIPVDSARYQNYASIRGPLALARNTLLPIGSDGKYALHPQLTEIQSLFNGGKAAFLANVGTMLQPTTRAEYLAKQVSNPGNLFSHQDQQLEWQSQLSNRAGNSGWAGRLSDRMSVRYNAGATVPMIASLSGDALFCNGEATSPVALNYLGVGNPICSDHQYCDSRLHTAQQISTMSTGVSLVQADNDITNDTYKYNSVLADAMNSASPMQTQFSATSVFCRQLQEIARMIQVRSALGVKRQIFFVGLGSFDTHGDQLGDQAGLLGDMNDGLNSFFQAMTELNVSDQVTAFTCSDFSRTFQPNSSNGSDHAWGSHHIILGGAVKGGSIYGTFPTHALGGPDDADSNGRWIPTTSSSQYASTLAQWFGVSASDLPYVLPYIGNFNNNHLGFI